MKSSLGTVDDLEVTTPWTPPCDEWRFLPICEVVLFLSALFSGAGTLAITWFREAVDFGGRAANFYFYTALLMLEGWGVCACFVVFVDSKSNFLTSLLVKGAPRPIYVISRFLVVLPCALVMPAY